MFALADAVEQVENELAVEKEKCAALTAQVDEVQVRAQQLGELIRAADRVF